MPEAPPTPGMRVLCRDAEWLVTRVDPSDYDGRYHAVHCIGADDLVRGHETMFLTQLDDVVPVDPRKTQLTEDTSSGYRLSRLFLESQLRQMPATGLEPDLEGLGAFTPMQYQLDAVSIALSQLRPRLLLADAVGLGKTIQVGMILTELMRRGRADRILVLAKKSMLTQFQSELWNRFAIPLVRLDSAGIAKLRLRIPANKNPFEVYHRVIISIDTLKNIGSYRHFLENTRWDVVVIDEAHNVAGASVPERHQSYRLARLLSRKTDSMLLTTATPHNGKRETFGRLISLLDPSTMPDPRFREYDSDDIRGFFLMRFKEDVREEAGENLSERILIPVAQTTTQASAGEEAAYAVLAELREATSEGRQSPDTKKLWKNNALVQYGIYKLFLSSPEACRHSVDGRVARETATNPDNPELPFLRRLQKSLSSLNIRNSSRYQLLKQQLEQMGWDGSPNSPRVLVFTEYRQTQDALAAALAEDFRLRKHSDRFEDQAKQTLAVIHGSVPDVHLMKTVEAFGTGSAPVRMLLATDVASEGINLHHECHHIIHYDLPWSIITLIQRNGRIDRFGQTVEPVLRYLMVNTQQGLLTGDREIFGRLIEKVEEINRSTRSGESQLKLYDPEKEEQYIAEKGLLAGNVDVLEQAADNHDAGTDELESLLHDASLNDDDDLRDFLLGDTDDTAETSAPQTEVDDTTSRFRLYTDGDFLREGYRYLAEQQTDSGYLPLETPANGMFTLTAPPDLKRRLGASDRSGGVIFGATAIPSESWPDNDQFRLTTDAARVELAIRAARNTSGYWAKETLCSEQHPILKWVNERLLMLVPRGQAPVVASQHLETGELLFCFIGQLSSRSGTPLVVDAHAVSFRKGGRFEHRPLRDALAAAKFDNLINAGFSPNVAAAQALIPSAVETSLDHMRTLGREREKALVPLLRREERRLFKWKNRRRELLEQRITELGSKHPQARRLQTELDEMEAYANDRQCNWLDANFRAAREPSTRLVLVIEGVN